MHYHVFRLKDPTRPGPQALLDDLKENYLSVLSAKGVTVFGVFQGLFGLASNELYLVTSAEVDDHGVTSLPLTIISDHHLVPTVRPVDHSPRSKEGIYVFRWFTVNNKDVDEIAALSNEAWQTFEAGFDTEVQALFAEPDRSSEVGTMLLITWYTDLAVWQASRQPPPEARENFMRRHALTLEATPIATRLVSGNMTPVIPGGQNKF